MEPAALEASLRFLAEQCVKVTHLVTDRSTTVRTLMKDHFPDINHQADPWHFVKVSLNDLYCWSVFIF